MSPQDNCGGAIGDGVVYSEESDGDLFGDSDCVNSMMINDEMSVYREFVAKVR